MLCNVWYTWIVDKKAATNATDYFTVGEAAAILSVSAATLRNWDKSGKFKAWRHPINGYRLYERTKVERLRDNINNPFFEDQQ